MRLFVWRKGLIKAFGCYHAAQFTGTPNCHKKTIEAERQYFEARTNSTNDEKYGVQYSEAKAILAALDVKAAALLTHLSIMIAVVGIIWSTIKPENSRAREIFGWEAIVYIAIAILLLFCFDTHGPHRRSYASAANYVSDNIVTVIFRRKLFRFCWYCIMATTIAFLITFVAELH